MIFATTTAQDADAAMLGIDLTAEFNFRLALMAVQARQSKIDAMSAQVDLTAPGAAAAIKASTEALVQALPVAAQAQK